MKVWLLRVLVLVSVFCLVISVAPGEQTQNEVDNSEKEKRQLDADADAGAIKLPDEIEQINIPKRELKNDVEAATNKIRDELEHENRQLRLEVENVKKELQEQKREILTQLEADKLKLQEQLKQVTGATSTLKRDKRATSTGGAVYVVWGRTRCPWMPGDFVYKGYAGGGHYSHTGAAVNLLCLTENPKWRAGAWTGGYQTFIYGTEYELGFPFLTSHAPSFHNHNTPCAVCRSPTYSSVMMIPGTFECVSGWRTAYHGYLVAGWYNHKSASEYICLDLGPEAPRSGWRNEDGYLLYRVQSKCGSLPCPPYQNNRPVTCVVCVK